MADFLWDADALRFRNAGNKRFVSPEKVRAAVDAVARSAADDLEALTRRLLAGETDLGSWERDARATIKAAHMASAAVAVGGRKQLTLSDLARAGNRLKAEYAYLRQFARQIDAGDAGTADQIAARIRLYGEAATTQYEETRRRRAIDGGWREERRLIGSSVPCAECSEYAARGWVPIGTNPPTGSECSCLSNCKCSFSYRLKRREPAA